MKERDRVGRERYGVPLQAGNGRKALVDAYQEALDQVVYLRQEIEERDAMANELRRAIDLSIDEEEGFDARIALRHLRSFAMGLLDKPVPPVGG